MHLDIVVSAYTSNTSLVLGTTTPRTGDRIAFWVGGEMATSSKEWAEPMFQWAPVGVSQWLHLKSGARRRVPTTHAWAGRTTTDGSRISSTQGGGFAPLQECPLPSDGERIWLPWSPCLTPPVSRRIRWVIVCEKIFAKWSAWMESGNKTGIARRHHKYSSSVQEYLLTMIDSVVPSGVSHCRR